MWRWQKLHCCRSSPEEAWSAAAPDALPDSLNPLGSGRGGSRRAVLVLECRLGWTPIRRQRRALLEQAIPLRVPPGSGCRRRRRSCEVDPRGQRPSRRLCRASPCSGLDPPLQSWRSWRCGRVVACQPLGSPQRCPEPASGHPLAHSPWRERAPPSSRIVGPSHRLGRATIPQRARWCAAAAVWSPAGSVSTPGVRASWSGARPLLVVDRQLRLRPGGAPQVPPRLEGRGTQVRQVPYRRTPALSLPGDRRAHARTRARRAFGCRSRRHRPGCRGRRRRHESLARFP